MSDTENDDENDAPETLPAVLEYEAQHETIILARSLCPFAESMDDVALLACIAFVEFRGDEKRTSEVLFIPLHITRRHIRSQLGQRVIAQLSRSDLSGTGLMIALNALKDIAGSSSASPAARVKAAERLSELATAETEKQGKGLKVGGGKNLNELTLGELEQVVEQVRQNMTFVQGIEEAVDIEPSAQG